MAIGARLTPVARNDSFLFAKRRHVCKRGVVDVEGIGGRSHTVWACGGQQGVRDRVHAAGKALERDVLSIIVENFGTETPLYLHLLTLAILLLNVLHTATFSRIFQVNVAKRFSEEHW